MLTIASDSTSEKLTLIKEISCVTNVTKHIHGMERHVHSLLDRLNEFTD